MNLPAAKRSLSVTERTDGDRRRLLSMAEDRIYTLQAISSEIEGPIRATVRRRQITEQAEEKYGSGVGRFNKKTTLIRIHIKR